MVFLLLTLTVLLLFSIHLLWKCSYWLRHGVHGPRALPILGNMGDFFLGRKHYGDVYKKLYEYALNWFVLTSVIIIFIKSIKVLIHTFLMLGFIGSSMSRRYCFAVRKWLKRWWYAHFSTSRIMCYGSVGNVILLFATIHSSRKANCGKICALKFYRFLPQIRWVELTSSSLCPLLDTYKWQLNSLCGFILRTTHPCGTSRRTKQIKHPKFFIYSNFDLNNNYYSFYNYVQYI